MLTIRSLVDVGSLGLRVLVPGGPAALDEPLRWLHTTELLDPSTYLRDRELVLTNGLWHDGANAAEFVANVARARGAGIVFGLRRVTPETPPDLVAACGRAGLPLVELAITVPFTELTRRAATELAGERQRALVDTVRRGNDLAAAISRGAGATGVLKVLRRDHHLPLAVIDRMGRVLAADGVEPGAETARRVAEGLKRHPPPLRLELGDGQGEAVLFLVNTLAGADAALVCLAPLDSLGDAEREALTQAAHYLSLEVARTELMRAIESRFAHELLEMILSGSRAQGEVAARLESFGVRPDGPLAVLAVAARGEVPADAALAERVGEFFPAEGTPAVVIGGSQDVVAIFPWAEDADALPALADRLLTAVGRAGSAGATVAGLGGIAEGSRGLRLPLRYARDACQVLRRGAGRRIAHFTDLGSHRLLLGAQDDETRRRFADSVLGPLRAHDAERGSCLEATVRAFLANDGRWAETAARLFVHVNTLRNRLAKVAELTGHDVTTTEGRVDLFLAVEADALGRH
ncbi:DNA-binding PucR family transcriptional regulator [Prauserella shujinwangii]|uniref:DNA-binding PucR family transcriptional regulator n=1 Tax=Prauserella shujinwangii TaxID=1453103 RepID=A0A2T0LYZ7_9PSEU|nr:helix-turn-helix domain-containing protein [Prauserella shujinwangii]PRX49355.1 DNA-binding PucR family transcriptional regulator [Prauserella shujinwangii]